MITLKRLLTYAFWTIIAFICTYIYTQIILSTKPESKGSFQIFIDIFYMYAFIHVWLITSSIIAFLYILIDIFYLKKRLTKANNKFIIRLPIIIGITVIVGATHYISEKVINVI